MFGVRARARSTETLTPWPPAHAHEQSLAYPVGAIIAIFYGSLLPFSFDGLPFLSSDPTRSIAWHFPSVEDALVNLLLYIPLGCVLIMSLRHRIRWLRSTIGWALAVSFGVSVCVELLQSGIAERVASWTDVCLNGVGAAFGAIAGVMIIGGTCSAAIAQRIRTALRCPGFWTVAVVTGVLLYALAPFDFVTDSAGLHDAFRRARWDVTQPRSIELTTASLGTLSQELTMAGWFALLGVLLARTSVSDNRKSWAIIGPVAVQGALLAALIEMMQLFTQSGVCDPASAALRIVATIFGAWLSVFVIDPLGQRPASEPRRRAAVTIGLGAFLCLQVLVLMMDVGLLSSVNWRGVLASHVAELPFEELWRGSMLIAAFELFAVSITSALLAGTLTLLAIQDTPPRARALGVTGTVAIMFSIEVLRTAGSGGAVDITGTIVAGCIAFVVTDAMGRMEPASNN